MKEKVSKQKSSATGVQKRMYFLVYFLAMCLVFIFPFRVLAIETTTSLLDISNWMMMNGSKNATINSGLLNIGPSTGIRSKQSYNQPFSLTWKGWFPLTSYSGNIAGVVQAPYDQNDYPINGDIPQFYTDWMHPNALVVNFQSSMTSVNVPAEFVSNGYVYGEYKTTWQNNILTLYYNGTKAYEKAFVSSSPISLWFTSSDTFFKIESISVTTGTQTTNGTCGAANLTTVTTAPSTNLCTTGTASTTTGTGPWYWTCDGTNGGTPSICTAYLSSGPVDPTLTKSKLYMGTDDRFTASNSGITIYGGPGYDTVTISDGISGVTLDQNVERINFSGTASAYAFKQTGNKINIYNASGSTLIATAPVQGDSDGTVLGFSDGAASALLSGGVMTLGGKTVSSTSAGVLTPTLTHVP